MALIGDVASENKKTALDRGPINMCHSKNRLVPRTEGVVGWVTRHLLCHPWPADAPSEQNIRVKVPKTCVRLHYIVFFFSLFHKLLRSCVWFFSPGGSAKAWIYYHEVMCPFLKILNQKSSWVWIHRVELIVNSFSLYLLKHCWFFFSYEVICRIHFSACSSDLLPQGRHETLKKGFDYMSEGEPDPQMVHPPQLREGR